jgi:precorrin-6B methylase 2
MVNDLPRGQRYFEAMQEKIRPGDIVLEIGTGAGLLSCLAARLGAGHVYTVEQNPVLHRIANEVVAANGLSDKVTLINAHSRDLGRLGVIERPIDVLVTETIGTQGLDEGIVTVFDDVTRFLAPDARVIPETVKFKLCLVNMSGIREQAEILNPILGVDMSPLNQEVKSNNLYWMHPIEPWRELSTIAETPEYSLRDFSPERSLQELEIVVENTCDGMLVWSEFKLAQGVSIETRYRYFGASWANSIHLMPRCPVFHTQRCISEFTLHQNRIGWTLNWTIEDK